MPQPIAADDGRLFGYARVSRAKGHVITNIAASYVPVEAPGEPSSQRQISDLKLWAEKRGQPITIEFDEGISGAEVPWTKRPGFQKLVRQMRRGDRLVIWRLDRLDRGLGQMIQAAVWLVEQGFKVHTLYEQSGDSLDLDTMQGKILLHVYSMLATIENDSRRAATSAGLQYNRRIGLRYGRWPGYGRKYEKRMLNGKLKTYIVWDAEECALIRELKERRDNGETWYRISLDFHQRTGGKISGSGSKWLTFDQGCIRDHKQGRCRKAKRVYAWYTLLLQYGLDLGEPGLPAGIDSMVQQFGVAPDLVAKLLPMTSREIIRQNRKNPKRRVMGHHGGFPSPRLPLIEVRKQLAKPKSDPCDDALLDEWAGLKRKKPPEELDDGLDDFDYVDDFDYDDVIDV